MANEKKKPGRPKTGRPKSVSPVEPIQSSTEAPRNHELEEANRRAAEAEERARKAEEALKQKTEVHAQPEGRKVSPGDTVNKQGQDICWNCGNRGVESILDDEGKCDKCGFDKDKLYNGNIEAARAAERQRAEMY